MLRPTVAQGPIIWPAGVAVAPATLITLVVAFKPVVVELPEPVKGDEKLTVAVPERDRPPRASRWVLFEALASCCREMSNWPPVAVTVPSVSA